MMKILNILEKLQLFILGGLIFILPLFSINIFPDRFDFPKILVLIFLLGILLLIRLIIWSFETKPQFEKSFLDLPLLLLVLVYISSTLLNPVNKYDSFFFPGPASILIISVLLYFLINNITSVSIIYKQLNIKLNVDQVIKFSLIASSVILSIFTILYYSQTLGIIAGDSPNQIANIFNPTGSPLLTICYLSIVLAIFLFNIKARGQLKEKVLITFASLFLFAGIFITIFALFKNEGVQPKFNPWISSWVIAIDSIKNYPIFGIGPGNYLTAFNLYKPLSFNLSTVWNLKFVSAHNFFLTAITETGLAGVAVYLILLTTIIKNIKKFSRSYILSIILALFFLFIFPSNILVLILFFLLLAISQKKKELTNPNSFQNKVNTIPFVILIIILIIISIFWFKSYKTAYAEYLFNQANIIISKNPSEVPIKTVHDYIRGAIENNPSIDKYHIAISRVNLAAATSQISQKAGSLTEEERTRVTGLIQTAIAEGKNAVNLNSQKSDNWDNLGQIYQSIIPIVAGSDQFAIDSYSNAINLEPLNPNSRIKLGGIYYAKGQFDAAIRHFELAVFAKNDFANSHYNLAYALWKKGDIASAYQRMKMVTTLVDADSPDYDLAKKALDELEVLLPKAENQAQESPSKAENLTEPPSQTTPVVQPPIELPKETNSTESSSIDNP